MEYTITLNDQQVEVLKTILAQIEPMPLIFSPVIEPRKLSKTEQSQKHMREYRAMKAERKRKK